MEASVDTHELEATGRQNEDVCHADGGDQTGGCGMRDWSGDWCNAAAAFAHCGSGRRMAARPRSSRSGEDLHVVDGCTRPGRSPAAWASRTATTTWRPRPTIHSRRSRAQLEAARRLGEPLEVPPGSGSSARPTPRS